MLKLSTILISVISDYSVIKLYKISRNILCFIITFSSKDIKILEFIYNNTGKCRKIIS